MVLTRLMVMHEIREAKRPRELSLKLVGKASGWHLSRLSALPANTFPPPGKRPVPTIRLLR